MEMIIVGIDPGTTVGYAVLSENGMVLKVGSGKGLSISEVVSNIIELGKPIIVGCDKKSPPSYAQLIATRLGARLFHPTEDLLVDEKRRLARSARIRGLNSHEIDALASALYAWQKAKTTLQKIDSFLDAKGKSSISFQFKQLLLRNEKFDYESALRILEEPTARSKGSKRERVAVVKDSRLEVLEAKILELESKAIQLTEQVREKQSMIDRISRPRDKEPYSRVMQLESSLAHERKLRKAQTEQVRAMTRLLAKAGQGLVVKKLANLGREEFERRSYLNIYSGDVLLVKDFSVRSQHVMDKLRGVVEIILTDSTAKTSEGFVLVKSSDLILMETSDFALIDSERLKQALTNSKMLKDILTEYKRERQSIR